MFLRELTQPLSDKMHIRRSYSSVDLKFNSIKYDFGSEWSVGVEPMEAARRAARLIIKSNGNRPIMIPLSGGIDSECMAKSFLYADVPFMPVIMRFHEGYNDFDTKWAFRFCQEFDLRPTVVDLNLEKFYASDQHLELAETLWLQ